MSDADLERARAQAIILSLAKSGEKSWSRIAKDLLELRINDLPLSWSNIPDELMWEMIGSGVTYESLSQTSLFENLDYPEVDSSIESELLDQLHEYGVEMTLCCESEFPLRVLDAKPTPPFLFHRGHFQDADKSGIAIIGTRKASNPALEAAKWFGTELGKLQVPVISGLAAGIDTAALNGAIGTSGRIIAVIGTGIDRYFPAENSSLQDEIGEAGLLISQFLPGASPSKKSFPMRNAIMSAYASASLVIQADDRSGARLQARIAAEQGRQVFLYEPTMRYESWANVMVESGKAKFVNTIQDVVS